MRNWLRRLDNRPYMTIGILIVTVGMFLVEILAGGADNALVLDLLGAKDNRLIIAGEWWRLITPIFLHGGLTHIVLNGVVIYFLGIQIEALFGHWRMLCLYLLGGISGNILSFAVSNTLSVGASTAIFALFGAWLMVGESFWEQPQIRQMAQQFLLLIVLNLGFDIFSPGVDIWGHVGGVLGGFLLGYVIGVPRLGRISRVKQIVAGITYLILMVALLKIGFTNWQ